MSSSASTSATWRLPRRPTLRARDRKLPATVMMPRPNRRRRSHPDYLSTRYAARTGLPVARVQHHVAHVLACMAENDIRGPRSASPGTARATARTARSGAASSCRSGSTRGCARHCLRPFPLPGGERAMREPRRSALGLLYACTVRPPSRSTPRRSARSPTLSVASWCRRSTRGLNAPMTTSMGRLFDAVASIIDLRQRAGFEGQAAMDLEWAADETVADAYPFEILAAAGQSSAAACARLGADGPGASGRCARWHVPRRPWPRSSTRRWLEAIVAVAEGSRLPRVALTGGCFQNRQLTRAGGHAAARRPDSRRVGTSACRRMTAASPWGKSPRSRAASTHRRSPSGPAQSRTTSQRLARAASPE